MSPPARPNLLPIAAIVSLLVLALGVTGLFSLHLANAKSAADLAKLDAIEHRLLLTLRTRATFKTQVQEWKNILLRGRDPADLATYRARFTETDNQVRAHLEELTQSPTVNGSISAPEAWVHAPAALLAEHRELSEAYNAAIATADFTRADTPFRIDASVRGNDRPLSDKLDAVAAQVERAAAAERQALGQRAAARYEGLRRITWIVAGLAMFGALWLCFRASRVAA